MSAVLIKFSLPIDRVNLLKEQCSVSHAILIAETKKALEAKKELQLNGLFIELLETLPEEIKDKLL